MFESEILCNTNHNEEVKISIINSKERMNLLAERQVTRLARVEKPKNAAMQTKADLYKLEG